MQVTPREPKEAVRIEKRGFRERCGSAGGEDAGRTYALQIA
jgi:hypothetical protein